jgi:hypothetical protein
MSDQGADDQIAVKNFDHMVDSLMIWEKNIDSRIGKLPNCKSTKEKIKSFVVQKNKCDFCKRSSHTEEHCWEKFLEQKPPVGDTLDVVTEHLAVSLVSAFLKSTALNFPDHLFKR